MYTAIAERKKGMEDRYDKALRSQTSLRKLTTSTVKNRDKKVMENSVSSWYELLHFCGGALETDKGEWYKICWVFDENNLPEMKNSNKHLNITSPKGLKIKSKHFQPNKPSQYLGAFSQFNGNQEVQTKMLCSKTKSLSRKISCDHIEYYYRHVYQQYVTNAELSYPLVVSSISNKKVNRIQKIIYPSVIACKGYNRQLTDSS